MLNDLSAGDKVILFVDIYLLRAEIEVIAISLVAILPIQQGSQDRGRTTAKIKGSPPFWSKGEDCSLNKISKVRYVTRVFRGVLMQGVLLEGLFFTGMESKVERDEFTL